MGPHESSWVDTWNERISVIRIEPHFGGAVTVFESFNCSGNSGVFYTGDYDIGAFTQKIKNKSAKGIKVDAKTSAFIYQHGGFGGWSKQIDGPIAHCDLSLVPGVRINDVSAIKVRSEVKKFSKGFHTEVRLATLEYPWT